MPPMNGSAWDSLLDRMGFTNLQAAARLGTEKEPRSRYFSLQRVLPRPFSRLRASQVEPSPFWRLALWAVHLGLSDGAFEPH
jgi:hypothetical protein